MAATPTPSERARVRRASGRVADFDGKRLSLARRLNRMPRTVLATRVDVTPAAITQFERDTVKPSRVVLNELALALGFPIDFFLMGRSIEQVPSTAAHFRSLRATPAISRDQALAFAEVALTVIDLFEQYVDFPAADLPLLPLEETASPDEIRDAAARTRAHFTVSEGPIPHMVRLLEAHGVAVLRLPPNIDERVDAFSTSAGHRPLVLLSPAKNDKARGRFDAAHELGHLIVHTDQEPGSKTLENAAHQFAAEFLAPFNQLEADLPRRLDWEALYSAKAKWGLSLKALAFRSHDRGLWSDATYRRSLQHLQSMGLPEPMPLGTPESPSMLGSAMELLLDSGTDYDDLAKASRLTSTTIADIVRAGQEARPRLTIVP